MKYFSLAKQRGFIGPAIDEAIKGIIVIAFIIGGVVFTLLWILLPVLWDVVKPFLHQLTQ